MVKKCRKLLTYTTIYGIITVRIDSIEYFVEFFHVEILLSGSAPFNIPPMFERGAFFAKKLFLIII